MRVLRVFHSAVVDAWRERERAMRRQGIEVELVSALRWDEAGHDIDLEPRPGESVVGARTWGTHPMAFAYDPRPLWRALRQDWDVVDIHEEPAALPTAEVLVLLRVRRAWDALRGRRRRAPAVVLYSAQNLVKRYPVPFRWFERWALREAKGISVCNYAAVRILHAKGSTGEIRYVPLGVDEKVFRPATEDRAPSADATIRVGYAGRLTAQKGVDVLLRAAAAEPRMQVLLAGAGPEETALRAVAEPLGDRVTFLGPLDTPALADFYRSLDVLVVPSLEVPGLAEQFGRVVVEAMACGTPVIATRTGSVADIAEGAAILVPPADDKALRESILTIADEPATRDELRRAGIDRAGTCSWDAVAAGQIALYEAALGRPAAPTIAAELPPVEVVVVAYGPPDSLSAALEPISGKYPTTVVDNSSLTETRAIVERAGATYVDAGGNVGFAAGVNRGLARRLVPGADVLLLNPDAVVSAEAVEVLRERLHATPRIASVGPAQRDLSGRPARVSWPLPTPRRAWLEAFGLASVRLPGDRSFVIGSVLLLNSAALDEIGTLDERFFLYAEETDWARRACDAGWHHEAVDEVGATHAGGGTSGDARSRTTYFYASQERYFRKHYGAAGWASARTAAIVGSGARALVRRGDARDEDLRRLRLHLQGPVSAETVMSGRAT